ncbi:hypothetical protein ACOMHN_046988 [Nucella lapillus]
MAELGNRTWTGQDLHSRALWSPDGPEPYGQVRRYLPPPWLSPGPGADVRNNPSFRLQSEEWGLERIRASGFAGASLRLWHRWAEQLDGTSQIDTEDKKMPRHQWFQKRIVQGPLKMAGLGM